MEIALTIIASLIFAGGGFYLGAKHRQKKNAANGSTNRGSGQAKASRQATSKKTPPTKGKKKKRK